MQAAQRMDKLDPWEEIHGLDCSLYIEPRTVDLSDAVAKTLLANGSFMRRGEGKVEEALAAFSDLPVSLQAEMRDLAPRFARLMNCGSIRIRFECVSHNACKKIHADYTDLRLIMTLKGQGSEYIPFGMPKEERYLKRMEAGQVGLFKGRLFREDHSPCYHRSPQIEGTGETRLLLVIDTPARGD
jgi:hypothetical protein